MKPVTIQGKEFPSHVAAAKYYGVSYKAMEARLYKGWSIEQALDLEPPDSHKSYNLWLRRTGKNRRVCSRCRVEKPLSEFYEKPDTATGTHGSQCRECTKIGVREGKRRREYGLTPKAWQKLFESQGKCCAICGTKEIDHEWHTDHCHKTDRVRGILCKSCNLMLGNARDNLDILYAAIRYLKSHRMKVTIHELEGIAKNSDEYVDPEEIS